MKILLTGAAGFLGKIVLKRMLSRGHSEIRILIRNAETARKIMNELSPENRRKIEVMIGDFCAKEVAGKALENVEKLVHVASIGRGTSSTIIQNNVVGSKVLLEEIVKGGDCKDILLVSSLAVYGLVGLKRGATVDEDTPLDQYPERRDLYTFSKILQEEMFQRYMVFGGKKRFNLCVVRPGPIYGPGGTVLPARIGLKAPYLFLNFGGRNLVPLTYLENCADGIAFLAEKEIDGVEIFNLIDPDIPTAKEYLQEYRKYVSSFHCISVPHKMVMFLSNLIEKYSERSEGQLPPILTRYKSENMWKRINYDSSKILHSGWEPLFSTKEGLCRTFKAMENRNI